MQQLRLMANQWPCVEATYLRVFVKRTVCARLELDHIEAEVVKDAI